MKKLKVMLAFGTRPEAIKMCPLVLEMKKNQRIDSVVCLTGQHREMLEQVMKIFNVEADYNLNIMKQQQKLEDITTAILKEIGGILEKEQLDIVLVHGDTTTSFAVALATFYRGIPIGHVEAGLRTYNIKNPFPEEFNRQCVDLISDIYFAPTQLARKQLLKEGKPNDKIYVTGNTVIDALKTTVSIDYNDEVLETAKGKKIILMTIHRRENLGKPMENIFRAVKRIAQEHDDVVIVYPVHKNPIIRTIANQWLGNEINILLVEPLDVITFHNYIDKCYCVLTDSGGIQEEAPSLGKPVLVARDTTERPEGVDAGVLKLIGTKELDVFNAMEELLTNEDVYKSMSNANNPYGDGNASKRIIDILLKLYGI